jgi:hypothetical protein
LTDIDPIMKMVKKTKISYNNVSNLNLKYVENVEYVKGEVEGDGDAKNEDKIKIIKMLN